MTEYVELPLSNMFPNSQTYTFTISDPDSVVLGNIKEM